MLNAGLPDTTYSVGTKTDLTKESTWTINGVFILGSGGASVYVIAENKIYQLASGEDYSNADNWKEASVDPTPVGPQLHDWDGTGTYKKIYFKKDITFTSEEDLALFSDAKAEVSSTPFKKSLIQYYDDDLPIIYITAESTSDDPLDYYLYLVFGNGPVDKQHEACKYIVSQNSLTEVVFDCTSTLESICCYTFNEYRPLSFTPTDSSNLSSVEKLFLKFLQVDEADRIQE